MAIARMPQTETTPRSEPRERRRHLRVVGTGERPRLQLRLTPRLGIGLTVLLFVALFAVAASHALLIEGQGRLDRLDQQVGEEQARYERLRAELASLESPERVPDVAEDLGMVRAEDAHWLQQSQAVSPPVEEEPEPETSSTSYPDMKPHLDPTP